MITVSNPSLCSEQIVIFGLRWVYAEYLSKLQWFRTIALTNCIVNRDIIEYNDNILYYDNRIKHCEKYRRHPGTKS